MFREAPPRAPSVPREITGDMVQDTFAVGRMFRLFGVIWGSIGLAGVIISAFVSSITTLVPLAIAIAGWSVFGFGRYRRARALGVFQTGTEVSAVVTSVALDYRVRVNQKNPWRVLYRFEANGAMHEGSYSCWTDAKPEIEVGANVIALYDPQHPSQSVLWTRVAPLVRIEIEEASKPPEEQEEEKEADARKAASP